MGEIPAEPEAVPEAKPAKGRKKMTGQRAFPSAPFFPENPVLEKAMADWLAYKRERRELPKTASGMKKLACSQKAWNERIVIFANLSKNQLEICLKLTFQSLIV